MPKLKIALIGEYPIIKNHPLSGPQRVCYNLYHKLKENGDLALTLLRPLNIKGKVKHAILSLSPDYESGECAYIYGLSVLLKLFRTGFDVIHFVGFPANIASALFLKRFLHGKMVYTVHGLVCMERQMGYSHSWFNEKVEKRLINKADQLVAVSDSLKSLIEGVHGLSPRAIAVIPNGVQSDFLDMSEPVRSKNELFQKYDLSSDSKIMFTAGGTREIRNIAFILEAFSKLNRQDTVLLVSGPKGSDHKILSRYNGRRVKYLGNLEQSQIKLLYQESDIYLQMSKYESFGLAPLEAMAAGCSVIVSDMVGMSYLIKDGVNGYIVKSGDVKDIIRKINILLDDRELRKEMGKQAYLTAKEMTWEKVAGTYVELYKELVG